MSSFKQAFLIFFTIEAIPFVNAEYSSSNIVSRIPSGAPSLTLPAHCSLKEFDESLQSPHNFERSEKSSYFFQRCFPQRQKSLLIKLWDLLDDSRMEYDYWKNPLFHAFQFKDRRDHMVPAYVAFRDDKPRPTVLFKCGVTCDLQNFAALIATSALFDETRFNLIALPSVTGSAYQQINNSIELGGADEGAQLFEIAQQLREKSSPFSPFISSLHIVGISLGAQAALFAGLYNDNNTGPPPIQSIAGACPVVDLESSMRNLFTAPVVGSFARRLIISQLQSVFSGLSDLGILFKQSHFLQTGAHAAEDILNLSLPYYEKLSKEGGWLPAPLSNFPIENSTAFWKLNHFQNWAPSLTHTPVLIWYSDDDPVVNQNNNGLALKELVQTHSNWTVISHPNGGHCSMKEVFDWSLGTRMFSRFIELNSPKPQSFLSTPLNSKDWESFFDMQGEQIHKLEWLLRPGSLEVQLNLELRDLDCKKDPKNKAGICYSIKHKQIPFSWFNDELVHATSNKTEAQALTRYLNTNYVFLDSKQSNLRFDSKAKYLYHPLNANSRALSGRGPNEQGNENIHN